MESLGDIPTAETPKKHKPEEKAPDSSENGTQKPKSSKPKKRKKPKDSTAPRHPLTGTPDERFANVNCVSIINNLDIRKHFLSTEVSMQTNFC